MFDTVIQRYAAGPGDAGRPLRPWLEARMGRWPEGLVFLNRYPAIGDEPLLPGDSILVGDPPDDFALEAEEGPLEFWYEDPHLVFAEKPRGLPLAPRPDQPRGSWLNRLLQHNRWLSRGGGPFLRGLVHPLDDEVGGLAVCAKNGEGYAALREQLADGRFRHQYQALVRGDWPLGERRLEQILLRDPSHRESWRAVPPGRGGGAGGEGEGPGGLPASLEVNFLARLGGLRGGWSLLAVAPLGVERPGQVRAMLAGAGFPVVGDPLHDERATPETPFCLHSWRLRVELPWTGKERAITADPPQDMMALIRELDQ